MTIKTLTTTLLLATSILLLTGCGDKDTSEVATEQNPMLQTNTNTGETSDGEGSTNNENTTIGTEGTIIHTETNTGISGDDEVTTSRGDRDENTSIGGGDKNDDNISTGGGNNNATTLSTATLVSLKLIVDKTSLNKDENATVKVMATYSDNSTKEVTDKVEWVVTPSDAVKMTNTILITLQDKAVTVKAKLNTVTSEAVSLNITWTVNGHVLPPEPDPMLNDATLLGVDSNNDGVRDDIERKVYATYPKAIQRAVMMQAFRAEQKMLADPDMVVNARKWAKEDIKAIDCQGYLEEYKNISEMRITDFVENNQYNTKERVKKYLEYDQALSGGVYTINDGILQDCKFDVDKILELDK